MLLEFNSIWSMSVFSTNHRVKQVWTCLNKTEHVWMNMSEHIWTHLNKSEQDERVWTSLDKSEQVGTSPNKSEQAWACPILKRLPA